MREKTDLSIIEKALINLFTPYDFLNPSKYMRHEAKSRFGHGRWVSICEKKEKWTKDLIMIKYENNGIIPSTEVLNQLRTPCGYLRLLVAYLH